MNNNEATNTDQSSLENIQIPENNNSTNSENQANPQASKKSPFFTTKKMGFVTVGLARVLNNGVVFLITFILVRFGKLDPSQIGSILYVLGIITIVSLLTDFGMTEGVQKFVNQFDPKKIIGPAILLEFIIVFTVGLFIAIFDREGILTKGENWLFFFAVLMSMYNIIILSFNGLHQQLKSSIYQILYVILLVFLVVLNFFYFKLSGLQSALLAFVGSQFLLNLIMIWDLGTHNFLEFSLRLPKAFVIFCLNNFVYLTCFLILTQTDTLFVNAFLGDANTGIYRSTAQIALFTRIIGLAVSTPLLPIFSKLAHEKNWQRLKKIFIIGQGLIGVCIIVMLSAATLFGEPILNLIYNNQAISQNGKILLPLLMLALGVQSLNMPTVMLFQATSREKIIRNGAFIQAIFYLVSLLFLTQYGLLVPAFVLLAVELLMLPIYYWNVIKILNQKNEV